MAARTVAVVGAGALGAAAAWHLARTSDAQVHVLDRGPGAGATRQGAGLLTPLVEHPEDVGLVLHSLEAYRELADAAPGFALDETGGLLVAGPEQRDVVERRLRVWRAHGVEVRAAEHGVLGELPGTEGLGLREGERAYVSGADAWLEPEAAVAAMLDRARAGGATVDLDAPVESVGEDGPLLADGERVPADATVLAAGVWTPRLLEGPWRPPVAAYRAQAVRLEHALDATPGPVVHDAPSGTYWRPAGPGAALVGDGTDLDPHDVDEAANPDGDIGERLAARFAARCPDAAPADPVEARAGYAAGTPDTRPLVGPAPGIGGVVLCAGANGFGIMRAPALGAVAASDALGRAPPVPATAVRPGRFEDPPRDFRLREGFSLDA